MIIVYYGFLYKSALSAGLVAIILFQLSFFKKKMQTEVKKFCGAIWKVKTQYQRCIIGIQQKPLPLYCFWED